MMKFSDLVSLGHLTYREVVDEFKFEVGLCVWALRLGGPTDM